MLAVTRSPERGKTWLFGLLMILVVVGSGILSAGPASAHTRLIGTTPADGKRLTASPGAVSLTFSEGVLKLGAAVKVSGPDGVTAVGPVKVTAKTVSWPLKGGLANGKYTVKWRVTSEDGHPIGGTFDFVLKAAAEPTGAPSPVDPATGLTAPSTPTYSPHTAEPEMTGPMPGMAGMSGTTQPTRTNSGQTTGLAIAGLLLLTVIVAGAIVIERRRRPPPGAGPSGLPSG